jgi:outer membrane immunogenic protein
MKYMISAAVGMLFTGAVSQSIAADMAVVEPPSEAPITEVSGVYDWGGFYVGANAGYAWTGIDYTGAAPAIDRDLGGMAVGGYAGFNFVNGSWVYGIEADVKHDFNEDRFTAGGTTFNAETTWGGSVRGRVGYAFDRTLIYGTAGYAFSRAELEDVGAGTRGTETFHGWTVGAGVEQAITDTMAGRIEYRYTDLSKSDIFGVPGSDGDINTHSVMVGVSFKF